MKKMKTTIAVALAACVSTSLIAQTVAKQDTITLSLTGAKQLSVSTSATTLNAGNWSQGPMFYKTTPVKVTDRDILKYIGIVLYQNANHYSSTKAKLVLVQGELSGFFNITPDLGISEPDTDLGVTTAPLGTVDPWYNEAGDTTDTDSSTALANSQDSTVFQLANGRHWDVNPLVPTMYPVGHLQPWGQIYIQDPVVAPNGENVTYFFALSVQECYDCFYLNSYISAASFKAQNTAPNGPPCCSGTSVIVGNGTDKYYLTFSFDNTDNNPYLANAAGNPLYIGDEIGNANSSDATTWITGVASTLIQGDGIVPDAIHGPGYATAYNTAHDAYLVANPAGTEAEARAAGVAAADLATYRDPIKSGLGSPSPYEARFTLNGVLTYTWKLALVDKQDLSPDFLGTGKYVANGYGFIGLYCSLFDSASITFSEKAVKAGTEVTGENWSDSWIGVGAEYVTLLDPDTGAATGVLTAYDNWYENLGQLAYQWGGAEDQFSPAGYPTPINVSTSLSYHENFNNQYPAHNANPGYAAWPTPAYVKSFYLSF